MAMNKSHLKLAACLVFLTAGNFYFIGGFPYSLPVFAGCQALWKLFAMKRCYLYVGTMVALLLLMAVENFYYPHIGNMGRNSSVWFKFLLGLVCLAGISAEIRSWRASQKPKYTPT